MGGPLKFGTDRKRTNSLPETQKVGFRRTLFQIGPLTVSPVKSPIFVALMRQSPSRIALPSFERQLRQTFRRFSDAFASEMGTALSGRKVGASKAELQFSDESWHYICITTKNADKL